MQDASGCDTPKLKDGFGRDGTVLRDGEAQRAHGLLGSFRGMQDPEGISPIGPDEQ